MHAVIADRSNNVLILLFQGRFSAEDGVNLLEKVEARLKHLAPGFKILNDMSELEEMSYDSSLYHKKVMDLCNQRGVNKVARVIPDQSKDIGFNIMSAFHYDKSVLIKTFATRDQAWEFISS